jgi:hypothetical protein
MKETRSQPIRRQGASVWRTVRRAAGALRAIHDEQILAWELWLRANRIPVDRPGPLTWTPSLDGPRLTGSHLHPPADTSEQGGP